MKYILNPNISTPDEFLQVVGLAGLSGGKIDFISEEFMLMDGLAVTNIPSTTIKGLVTSPFDVNTANNLKILRESSDTSVVLNTSKKFYQGGLFVAIQSETVSTVLGNDSSKEAMTRRLNNINSLASKICLNFTSFVLSNAIGSPEPIQQQVFGITYGIIKKNQDLNFNPANTLPSGTQYLTINF